MKKTIVTSALPYANGPIHIGHLAGAYLPADIFTRFKKLMGDDVIYISGTDEHGTPITFQAEKQGISPMDIVNKYHKEILDSLNLANIEFDYFSRTTKKDHYELTQQFFNELHDNGFIETKITEQFYCSDTKQFLPDRYIEGECPSCGYDKARGDECPSCGKWLDVDKLKNPKSPYCKGELAKKETKHWYLRLDLLQENIEKWLHSKPYWKHNVINFIEGWFKEGLKSRAITRDLSWGVPLPIKEENGENAKVLYVWFDAPIGYISMTKEWALVVKGDKDLWKSYWQDENTHLVHFIGKDNIPFHAVVWPGMIMGQTTSYVLPTDIPANEHLTINGEKISTSLGNCIWVEDVANQFSSDYLRFYLAANAPENKDADFSWKSFGQTINTELINVIGNLHQRVTTFISTHIKGNEHFQKGSVPPINLGSLSSREKDVLALIDNSIKDAKNNFYQYKVKDALKIIVNLSREGNVFMQEAEPWNLIKEDETKTYNLFNILVRLLEATALLLFPIIPSTSKEMLKRIGFSVENLNGLLKLYEKPLDPEGRVFIKMDPIFIKIDDKDIQIQEKLLEEKIHMMNPSPENNESEMISIDDFKKIHLQTGEIIAVEKVNKSKKLLCFQIKTEKRIRQILSGIAEFYPLEQELVGKNIIFVENLKPVTLMGLLSEGMILSAENEQTGKLEVVTISKEVGHSAQVK